jgi:hypothetical protein
MIVWDFCLSFCRWIIFLVFLSFIIGFHATTGAGLLYFGCFILYTHWRTYSPSSSSQHGVVLLFE